MNKISIDQCHIEWEMGLGDLVGTIFYKGMIVGSARKEYGWSDQDAEISLHIRSKSQLPKPEEIRSWFDGSLLATTTDLERVLHPSSTEQRVSQILDEYDNDNHPYHDVLDNDKHPCHDKVKQLHEYALDSGDFTLLNTLMNSINQ